MFNDGNEFNAQSDSRRWWQVQRSRPSQRDADLSSYRRLAVQLHHGLPRASSASRSVLVVTPNEALHWASGALTLACCMAEELHRPVLLAEIYDSKDSPIMKRPGDAGLADFLKKPKQTIEELAMPTSQPNLWYLSTGLGNGQPVTLSMDSAKSLLSQAADHWDFIILGGGPLLSNPSALAVAPHVGSVLLLVMENRTQLEDIDLVHTTLQQCGAENVSLVLTEPDEAFQ